MKSLLVFVFLMMSQITYATSIIEIEPGMVDLNKGDYRLVDAKVELIGYKERCPFIPGRPSCKAIGGNLILKVTLSGCGDNFGPIYTNLAYENDQAVLFVSAVNIVNKKSEVLRCVQAKSKFIHVFSGHGNVELRQLFMQSNF